MIHVNPKEKALSTLQPKFEHNGWTFEGCPLLHRLVVTGEEEEHIEIPAKQQARFSRVVAEMQMLGFIRTSNKKTDHVARLTFGGS